MVGFIVFGIVLAVVLGTSLIKNVEMSDKVKNLIAVVLSTVGGVVTDLTTRGFDFGSYQGADILGTVLVIYGASQLIYKFILNGTSVDEKLESVEVIPTKSDSGELHEDWHDEGF